MDKTEGNYQQSFRAEDHAIYFKLLSKELNQASSSIYFLGCPPSSEYTGQEAIIMNDCYDGHLRLIAGETNWVNIHRFILDPYTIQDDFLDCLEILFKFNVTNSTPRFRLFVSNEVIPLDSDLILIDPDTAAASSISSYLRERKTGPGNIPVR